ADDPLHGVAGKLAQAIARPEIIVFTISVALPIFTAETGNSRDRSIRYGQFLVKHVASQLEHNCYDDVYDVSKPFDEFIAGLDECDRPEFIFSASPQCILPLNYDRVQIPKLMWCHDTDLFLYRGYDNFLSNTINIVTTSQEHFELSRSLGVPAVSNIMSDTLCMPARETRLSEDKDIDILFTGAAVIGLHSEKSRFVYYLNKISDEFSVRVVDGHLPEREYDDLLKRSRFTPIINRYAGATSPRWREGLAQGGLLLFPQGTPYADIAPGAFPFRADHVEEDLRCHLRARRDTASHAGSPYNVDEILPGIDAGLAFLRDSREKQVERQLRFCLFQTLLEGAKTPAPRVPPPRRITWYVPPVDAMQWGRDLVKSRMLGLADGADAASWRDDRDYNNAALIYVQVIHALKTTPSERARCEARRHEIMAAGLERYPRSLLLRFNDAHWDFMQHVKDGSPVSDGVVAKFQAILRDSSTLDFDPESSDLGVAYTLSNLDQVFPYYDYGQMMVCWLVHQRTPESAGALELVEPRQVVLAAVHGYLAWAALLRAPQGDIAATEAAAGHLRISLQLFGGNLPVKQLYFRSLARAYATAEGRHLARDLLNAFFVLVNHYPAALATDIGPALAAAEQLDEPETLARLVEEWATFTGPVAFVGRNRVNDRMVQMLQVIRYQHLFPPRLKDRIAQWRQGKLGHQGKLDWTAMTQHERDLFTALSHDEWRQGLRAYRSTRGE
ncbi:MAG: hypothetical protein K2X44_03135, partial [Magnetospirillum sp.]|nr:hypothetical protein [Magnetospirillum sp.]